MSAPPASLPYAGQHGTNHTDECDESYYGIEPADEDIGDDDPIEIESWSGKVAMEILLFLLHNSLFILKIGAKIRRR